MFDQVVILSGEIGVLSLIGLIGLKDAAVQHTLSSGAAATEMISPQELHQCHAQGKARSP